MSVGRAYHADGPENENALSPNFVRRRGTVVYRKENTRFRTSSCYAGCWRRRGGFRHVQHVWPNRGPQKWGPHMRTKKILVLSCPWKCNDNTQSLHPDTFSMLWMVPKCFCGRGSAPNPAGGAYSAPPDPLAGGVGARCFSPRVEFCRLSMK